MEENTSFPLVVIGVGVLVTIYNPANLRFLGYLTIAAGMGMFAVRRS